MSDRILERVGCVPKPTVLRNRSLLRTSESVDADWRKQAYWTARGGSCPPWLRQKVGCAWLRGMPCSAAFCTRVCSRSARLLETWPTNPLPSTNKSHFVPRWSSVGGGPENADRGHHEGHSESQPQEQGSHRRADKQ